jgi:hypothetical protein
MNPLLGVNVALVVEKTLLHHGFFVNGYWLERNNNNSFKSNHISDIRVFYVQYLSEKCKVCSERPAAH